MNLPALTLIKRKQPAPRLENVRAHLRQGLASLNLKPGDYQGAKIALTAGSRGISDIALILHTVGQFLRELGSEPFVVPSMGSHGGATAEGQTAVLQNLGVTEESVEMPIKASMETELIGHSPDGVPLHMDKIAWQSDGVVLINRVKPHSGFDGPIESGMMKMAVIGLGNHNGAKSAHQAVMDLGYNRVISRLAQLFIDTGKIRFGVAILENANHGTADVVAVPAASIFEMEKQLLKRAKDLMARLPSREIDILIVDEMGKEISGVGMDPNVIGRRMFIAEPEPESPKIGRIFVRRMATGGGGNGLGIGLADFALRALVDEINWKYTYTNAITSGTPEKARCPVVCENDREALEYAVRTCRRPDPGKARIMWVRNTLNLEKVAVSPALLDEVLAEAGAEKEGELSWDFTQDGDLPFLL